MTSKQLSYANDIKRRLRELKYAQEALEELKFNNKPVKIGGKDLELTPEMREVLYDMCFAEADRLEKEFDAL